MELVAIGLRVVGAVLLAFAVIRFMLIGKQHHDRSGNPSLTPTFKALEPDLMKKSGRAIKFGVAGGLLLGLSYVLSSESGLSSVASNVTVTASKIRLLPDTSQPIQLEVRVDLVIANNGRRPMTFDGMVGEFFINDNRTSATRSSLVRPRTIGAGEKISESIESKASNFGMYSDPEIRRRVELSLLRNGKLAYGPFSIAAPADLRP